MAGTPTQTQAPTRMIAAARPLHSRMSRTRQLLTCLRTPQQRWLLPPYSQAMLGCGHCERLQCMLEEVMLSIFHMRSGG